ncbi:MAG: pilus assembly protein TadG-related protein [Gaiellaceae bacterium]
MIRDQRGQAAALTLVFLTVLLGATAMVLDVGSWYQARRQLQATADAAVLAAAQELPDTATARIVAADYARRNAAQDVATSVTISSGAGPNDTISVRASRSAPGFFARVFGIDSVSMSVSASARAARVSRALGMSPLALNELHPLLHCVPQPCTGQPTSITFHHPGSGRRNPFAFAYVNIDPANVPTLTAQILAQWIRTGVNSFVPVGTYQGSSGLTYLTPEIRAALEERMNETILLPVFRSISGNAFAIVGWAGFRITGLGNTTQHHWVIYGHFTTVVQQSPPDDYRDPDSGEQTVALIE